MCIFNIEHQLFQPLNALAGDIPPYLEFYAVESFVPPVLELPENTRDRALKIPVRHSTGSASKSHPYLANRQGHSGSRLERHHSTSEFHILCGWPKGPEGTHSANPKFWKLKPSRSSCYLMSFLDIPELESDEEELTVLYYHFVVVGKQILLLGTRDSPARPRILDLAMEIPSDVFL